MPDLDLLEESGAVGSITGHEIVITGLQAHSDGWWNRGFVERDGLQILIREWVSGTTFTLAKIPPADWDGEDLVVTPGCDKTATDCGSAKWKNQNRFGGIGYALPTYNPTFESPG